MPLTEKGCYIQFYKGPGGTDPTERGILVGGCTEPRTIQLPLHLCEWGLRKAVVGQIWVWVCFLFLASSKNSHRRKDSVVFWSLTPVFSRVMVVMTLLAFSTENPDYETRARASHVQKKFLKKAKINHPWKNNKGGMWTTQHFPWLVYLSHTITIKWLTCLYPLQRGFFAFSRGSAPQPTTQFYYFVLAILVLRYSNPFPFPPQLSKFSRLKFKVNSNVII